MELELWDYDPGQFSDTSHVDLLSLYASLKEETDERVLQALEEVLRGNRGIRTRNIRKSIFENTQVNISFSDKKHLARV